MEKKEIDIFKSPYPDNHRWDRLKNGKLLNIIFHGGTYGNFLKFFLEKFSKLTPEIEHNPFNEIGTSHVHNMDPSKKIKFSGLFQRYHASFINDNKEESGLPICLILPQTEKDYVFLKTSQIYRANDRKITPDLLWQMDIKKINDNDLLKPYLEEILSLYNISKEKNYIPKFIVRDWYKLEFLQDIRETFNYRWFKSLEENNFFKKQKVFHFPLESFFNFDIFLKNLKELDRVFNLQLDFEKIKEMKDIFMIPFNLDFCRQHSNLTFEILDSLNSNENKEILKLDVSFEAYIYAYIEKKYSFVTAPLTNYFFEDTDEIRSFVESYPEHYKAMNPNLSTFKGQKNPFYLWKNRKK